ncbi:MAG TPA: PQQ-binding-like beta-propeller repeat protein [Acidobacteriaceae bacterium]|nr:PQQ-binding-like beta-propeller repeat protein [Acidobacteriaceae bacterium]
MRYVFLCALITSTLWAQDGAAIYNQRCASCHATPAPRVPSFSTIKAMSSEAIYLALTQGAMKTQAEGLSSAQLFALIRYIAPTGGARTATALDLTPTCKDQPAFSAGANTPAWNGWSPKITNTRFQDAASADLAAADLGRLKLKWAFNLGDVTNARSQPAVSGRYVFIGSSTGALYALDADSGCTFWGFRAASGIRGGAAFGDATGTPAVFFSDTAANVYAVNAQTGKLIWKVRPVDHFATVATATPRYYHGVLYQAFSSFEEALGGDPKYQCCTFRGSVVALNPANGVKLWQTFTIRDPAKPTRVSPAGTQQYGPSGAAVWSTPTIDEQLGALYVATGDNYSDPPTTTSDAVLALDLKTGELLWSHQLTSNDAFNNACSIPIPGNCPATHGSDQDFGQPPILLNLGAGKRALVLAQKSGMAWALDPDAKGKLLWQTRVGNGGIFGGSQWGSASDEQRVYVAISDLGISAVPDTKSPKGYRFVPDPHKGGGLDALDPRTGKIVWSTPAAPCAASRTDCSPAQSAAVTAIPGVVFSGSVDGHLRAYSASTGRVLWDTDTARDFSTVNGKPARGGSIDGAGPAVVNGMIFVNSGYGQWGGMPGNVLLAFSVQ